MTNQEAFNKIVARLMDGMGQAADRSGCMYRAPNGLKCAVGCLIPDDEYDPRMESRKVSRLGMFNLQCLNGLNLNMLSNAQYVHDCPDCWNGKALNHEGVQMLQEIAANYNLTMPDISNA